MARSTFEDPGHPDLQATDARQGRRGVPVLWVLILSTVVALLVVALVWAGYSHKLGATSPPQVKDPAQAAALRTTP